MLHISNLCVNNVLDLECKKKKYLFLLHQIHYNSKKRLQLRRKNSFTTVADRWTLYVPWPGEPVDSPGHRKIENVQFFVFYYNKPYIHWKVSKLSTLTRQLRLDPSLVKSSLQRPHIIRRSISPAPESPPESGFVININLSLGKITGPSNIEMSTSRPFADQHTFRVLCLIISDLVGPIVPDVPYSPIGIGLISTTPKARVIMQIHNHFIVSLIRIHEPGPVPFGSRLERVNQRVYNDVSVGVLAHSIVSSQVIILKNTVVALGGLVQQTET